MSSRDSAVCRRLSAVSAAPVGRPASLRSPALGERGTLISYLAHVAAINGRHCCNSNNTLPERRAKRTSQSTQAFSRIVPDIIAGERARKRSLPARLIYNWPGRSVARPASLKRQLAPLDRTTCLIYCALPLIAPALTCFCLGSRRRKRAGSVEISGGPFGGARSRSKLRAKPQLELATSDNFSPQSSEKQSSPSRERERGLARVGRRRPAFCR